MVYRHIKGQSAEVPENLIFDGGKIEILFEETTRLNRTKTAIVIEGNPNGFLSLSNCLIYLANALVDVIDLSELPFVVTHVPLFIRPDEVHETKEFGKIIRDDDSNFIWDLNEYSSTCTFGLMHSLGHLNLDLHLDDEMEEEDISIYCVVMD